MRNFSATLKSGLASEVTTLGWLMSITRRDGTVIRLNTIGTDYTWSAQTWYGYPGFIMGNAKFSDSLDPATLSQGSAADSLGPITFTDVVAGLYSGASVRLYLIDYTTGEGGEIGFKWQIGTISAKDNGAISIDIWSALRTNHALFLKKYGPGCTASLGDSRCGVDLAGSPGWIDDVTVVGANVDAFSFVISGARAAAVDGWYQDGAIVFDSGENLNFAYDIRRWVQSTGMVYLRGPLRRPLVNGTTARIHPGCDKTTGANGCSRFSNNARFQGQKYLPDSEAKFSYESEVPPATVTTTTTSPTYSGRIPAGTGGSYR